MVITPNSKVKLIKNPLKLDSNNEITFANATAQYNYFTSLPKLEVNDFTYVRKDGILRIPTDETATGTTYEDLLQYNFCMYQNTAFDSKWFYAFITEVTWINPSVTELKLETAYFQTWQFDLVFADSFIEREHVTNDNVGANLIDENLPVGEYMIDNTFDLPFFTTTSVAPVLAVTELVTPNGVENIPFVPTQGNVFSGMCFITPTDSNYTAQAIIRKYDEEGQADAIKYVFMMPTELIAYGSTSYGGYLDDGTTAYSYKVIDNNSSYGVSSGAYNKPSTIGGYTPKNKKLLQYPYCYLSVDSHSGNIYNFHYEDFTSAKYAFSCDAILTVGGSVKITPVKYKSTGTSYTYGFTGAKFPTCGWISDTYTNWLTQNSVNLGFTTVSPTTGGLLQGAVNLLAGNITSGLNGIFNTFQSDYRASLIPDQARGNENAGDINFDLGLINPTVNEMAIKPSIAQVIDGYFSMFGYKVNRLGKPHITARTYYDYIKTIDVNIEGNIPEMDLDAIRKMFNNGIRFWHSTTYYLDFSVNNSIVSPTPTSTPSPSTVPTTTP